MPQLRLSIWSSVLRNVLEMYSGLSNANFLLRSTGNYLSKNGITAAAIHGNKSQGARTKALAGFKAGKVRVLVATDIAARGLDIPLLPHVVNYELPNVSEDYVHRIGGTGRAGASGEAISLATAEEMDLLWGIEKLIDEQLSIDTVQGYEPT